jgi:hypothetical protein
MAVFLSTAVTSGKYLYFKILLTPPLQLFLNHCCHRHCIFNEALLITAIIATAVF